MESIDKDILHKEIDLVQNCIARMAHNSFLIKGWAIAIVAVVLALADDSESLPFMCVVLLISLSSFWYLDAFFLQTEKMYREMYKWNLEQRKMGSREHLYDLNPKRFAGHVDSRFKVMKSITLRCFYGIPVLVLILIFTYSVLHPSLCNS